jgi:hypothetical protein
MGRIEKKELVSMFACGSLDFSFSDLERSQ